MWIMMFSNSLSVEKKLLQVKISEKEGGEKWIQNQEKKIHGMILASLAASLWSISGISGEILFKKYNFSSDWLVSTRTLISGILLFLIVIFVEKKISLKATKKQARHTWNNSIRTGRNVLCSIHILSNNRIK